MRFAMKLFAASLIAGCLTSSADAAVYSDNFDGYGSTTILNASSAVLGGNWTVTDGAVDLIATGSSFSEFCLTGSNCIDLDGSSSNAGLFATTASFGPGTYTVAFDLWGSQRGDTNTVTVRFGGNVLDVITLATAVGVTSFLYENILVSGPGGVLSFENAGGDDYGALLDNVAVTPLPAALPLMAAALGGFGFMARRSIAKR